MRRPPCSPLFPYTTLFRSAGGRARAARQLRNAADEITMAIADALLPEFDHEMTVTRKLLERVPEGHFDRSEEHTSELQSPCKLVCRHLPEKKKALLYLFVV